MRLLRRRLVEPALPGVIAHARAVRPDSGNPVRATRAVAGRVRRGDIVVLDQLDLDRVSAETLAAAEPSAVVNVRSSLSGRHPARGAGVLVGAGITVVDDAGPGLLSAVRDGQVLRVHDGDVYDHDRLLGHGDVLTTEAVADAEDKARRGMLGKLEAAGADAVAFLRGHEAVLLEGIGLPSCEVPLAGRPVLVVGPGERSATEARALRRWVGEYRPVVIGAGEGAKLAAEARLRVDLIVGDPGPSAAEFKSLQKAARIDTELLPAGLSPADVAVLLGAAGDARLIVLTGAPASYDELLDRDRDSAASLLAVRLRAGSRLVDATAVIAMQRPAVGWAATLAVVGAGVAALAVALAAVPGGHDLLDRLRQVLPW